MSESPAPSGLDNRGTPDARDTCGRPGTPTTCRNKKGRYEIREVSQNEDLKTRLPRFPRCGLPSIVYYITRLRFDSRPLAEVAAQRDVVVLCCGDATVHRLRPGRVGKHGEQVLQLRWRKSRVLILVQNIQRNQYRCTCDKKRFPPPLAHYLIVLFEEPLEELVAEMVQLCRTTDRHAQPGNANTRLIKSDVDASLENDDKTELTADRGSRRSARACRRSRTCAGWSTWSRDVLSG